MIQGCCFCAISMRFLTKTYSTVCPATPRALTVKGVYEVSYNRYGQIIERVCMYVKLESENFTAK